MWALGLAIAWGSALRTNEWVIKDGRSIHTPATLYYDSVHRNYPQPSLLYIAIPVLKNWRLGVEICFEENFTEFCVLTIFNKLLNYVIKVNNIIVPEGTYPLLSIPHNSPLFNLSSNLKIQKPIQANLVKPKLHKLCQLTGLQNVVYGYSIRRGVITWAANNGAPPLLLQIFGRWSSDSYKRYIIYSKRDLAQLSYCVS